TSDIIPSHTSYRNAYQKSESIHPTRSNCALVSCIVIACVGALFVMLGAFSIFGTVGSIGSIASLSGGGISFVSSLIGIMYFVPQTCPQSCVVPKEKHPSPPPPLTPPKTPETPPQKPPETTLPKKPPHLPSIPKDVLEIKNVELERTFWEMHFKHK